MTDPVADLIARERLARGHLDRLVRNRADWAAKRRDALNRLHEALGTWQKVADVTGQKLAAVHKAANQPRKKQQT